MNWAKQGFTRNLYKRVPTDVHSRYERYFNDELWNLQWYEVDIRSFFVSCTVEIGKKNHTNIIYTYCTDSLDLILIIFFIHNDCNVPTIHFHYFVIHLVNIRIFDMRLNLIRKLPTHVAKE